MSFQLPPSPVTSRLSSYRQAYVSAFRCIWLKCPSIEGKGASKITWEGRARVGFRSDVRVLPPQHRLQRMLGCKTVQR